MNSAPRETREGSGFVGGVVALSVGTGIAQALVLITGPLLSRLFSPEAFGLLGIYGSALGILTPFGCFMYYLALVLPKEYEETADLLGLCFLLILGTTVLVAIPLLVLGDAPLAALGLGELGHHRVLLLLGLVLTGLGSPLRTFQSRKQQFVLLAVVRVLGAAATAGVAIGASWLGAGTGRALLVATVVGLLVPAVVQGVFFLREDAVRVARSVSFAGMRRVAVRYRNFPYFVTATSVLSQTTAEIPTIFLNAVFAATVTGFYTLARRATVAPLTIFGLAIAEVFFQRAGASRDREADLSYLVEGVGKRLITISLLPALILLVAGPQLFSSVFGARWAESGLFAGLLAVDQLGGFVGGGISRILLVLERQRLEVFLNVLAVSAGFAALAFGGLVLHDARAAILLYAFMGLAFGMTRLIICVRLTRSRGRVIWEHVLRLLLYAVPTAAIPLAARWAGASDAVVSVAAVLACVPYGLLVLREDHELRNAFLRMLGRRAEAG